MLLANQPAELPNSDLYTGYNEFDPLLDSKVGTPANEQC